MGIFTSIFGSSKEHIERFKANLKVKSETLRFPGFKERSDENFLKHQQDTESLFRNMTDISIKLVSLIGLHEAIVYILEIATSQIYYSSLEDDMLKMKEEVVEMVHSIDRTEMRTITYQLNVLHDPDLSVDDRKRHLAIADNTCYALLQKFLDEKFYLKKYPLAFSPFLMTFVAVYIPIAKANYKLTETKHRKQQFIANMNTLMDIVIYFKEESVKERLNYIVYNFITEENPSLTDDFLNVFVDFTAPFYLSYEIGAEVQDWYIKKVQTLYESYYEPALRTIKETIKEIDQ